MSPAGTARLSGEVLVTWPDYPIDDPAAGGLLREIGLTLSLAPRTRDRTPAEVAELVSSSIAAIVSTDPFDASVFKAARNLKVVARVGVGTDSIDLHAASRAGVLVTIVRGVHEETVADHTLAVMLAALRRVLEHDAAVRRGEWRRMDPLGLELSGATVGLIGFGAIGRAVARRLYGFGAHVLAYDVVTPTDDAVEPVDLTTLLERSQFVSVHVPLTERSRGLIGQSEIARMRRGSILVNTSRGGIVDEPSLVEALQVGHLRAAALDVFEHEPPLGSPLLELPNVVLTPHVAGFSERSVPALVRGASRSVVDVLQGKYASAVNLEALAFNGQSPLADDDFSPDRLPDIAAGLPRERHEDGNRPSGNH